MTHQGILRSLWIIDRHQDGRDPKNIMARRLNWRA